MKEKLWTRSYIMTLAIMFGLFVSAGVVMSVIGIYAKNLTGLDTYAGMMFTTYGMGALAVRFLAGNLVDRFSAKSVILAGTLILGVGSLWQYLAPDITQLLFSRVFQGAGFGLATTAAITQLAMICPPSRLVDGVGFGAVAQSLSAVLSPLIGFRLIGSEYTGFPLLFLASLAIVGVTFLLVFFTKQGENSVHTEVSTDDGDGKIRWSWLSLPVLILFLSSLSQSSIMSFLPLFAIEKNFGGVGSFFSINAIGMIASRFVMGALVNRYKKFPLIFYMSAVFGATVFLFTQVTSFTQLLLIAFPAGFAMGSVAPFINTFLLEVMPGNKKGLASGLYFSTIDIGYGLGPVMWGVVAMSFGYSRMYLIAATLQIAAVLLTLSQIKLLRKNRSNIL